MNVPKKHNNCRVLACVWGRGGVFLVYVHVCVYKSAVSTG